MDFYEKESKYVNDNRWRYVIKSKENNCCDVFLEVSLRGGCKWTKCFAVYLI